MKEKAVPYVLFSYRPRTLVENKFRADSRIVELTFAPEVANGLLAKTLQESRRSGVGERAKK